MSCKRTEAFALLTIPHQHDRRDQMSTGKRFLRSDEGIAVTEYGLLVALIAIALIAVVTIFGNEIASWFSKKTGQITTV